jgi:FMN phosphatase YigB (HAD superfamily)
MKRTPPKNKRKIRRPVFLFDVDNTLLDNDRVSADLKHFLTTQVGQERQRRYWALFEELRTELGYADYLGALQRYRIVYPHEAHLLTWPKSSVYRSTKYDASLNISPGVSEAH